MAVTDTASSFKRGATAHSVPLLGQRHRLFSVGWKVTGLAGKRGKVFE